MMNVIVLAAGGEYLETEDGKYPICLTEFQGRPLLQHVAESLDFEQDKIIFIFQERQARKYHLSAIAELLSGGRANVVEVPENTAGAATTALLGCVKMDQGLPLLIISSNQLTDIKLKDFTDYMNKAAYDAGTVVFESIHPRYSFVSLDADGTVTEAAEKRPISRNATAGIYWFSRTADFVGSVEDMIRKDARVGGHFYICPSFNEMILAGRRVGAYKIDASCYHPLKNSHHVDDYINENR
ncbi:glycosyltransferase family 2 protein [Pseudomonas protegens]|uniref:glycosyltransferase family 2 protein n=1 Tax=Pseudomonas protegens TaxID=380021 RepID=UPI0020254D4B|nr:glycosyltransferase family 2 protein [Pseudomonas protegens]MCL9657975.1 glycosyltransferase family 2 protein [Pseudomonas protegens]